MSADQRGPAAFGADARPRPTAARAVRDGRRQGRRRGGQAGVGGPPGGPWRSAFVLGTVWLVIVLLPVYYMVLASFRTQGQYLSGNPGPRRWPQPVVVRHGLVGDGLGTDFRNSAVITLATIIIVVLFSLGRRLTESCGGLRSLQPSPSASSCSGWPCRSRRSSSRSSSSL